MTIVFGTLSLQGRIVNLLLSQTGSIVTSAASGWHVSTQCAALMKVRMLSMR